MKKNKNEKFVFPEHLGTDELEMIRLLPNPTATYDYRKEQYNFDSNVQPYLASIFHPVHRKHDYRHLYVHVGVRGKGRELSVVPNDSRNLVGIDFSRAKRILVVGSTGSGKTFLTRSVFLDRAYRSGIIPVVLTDLKPEYFTSVKPVQKELWKLYLKYEKPTGLPIKVYYPKCFEKLVGGFNEFKNMFKRYGVEYQPIAISFRDLTFSDFTTLLGTEMTDTQLAVMEDLFIQKSYGFIHNYDELIKALKKNSEFDKKTIAVVQRTIKNAINYETLSEKYPFDVVNDINNNRVPILALPGWDTMGKYSKHYPAAFVSVFLRYIIRAKQKGIIPKRKRLAIIIEEAEEFVSKRNRSSSKEEILSCFNISRQYGISMIFLIKVPDTISDVIVTQPDYIFIAHNIDSEVADKLFKRRNLLDVPVNQYKSYVRDIIRAAKKYEWIMINSSTKRFTYVKILSPLSFHRREGD